MDFLITHPESFFGSSAAACLFFRLAICDCNFSLVCGMVVSAIGVYELRRRNVGNSGLDIRV